MKPDDVVIAFWGLVGVAGVACLVASVALFRKARRVGTTTSLPLDLPLPEGARAGDVVYGVTHR